jgi:hypothetical protein
MSLKDTFTWLAQPPQTNYTLGELFQTAVQSKDISTVNANPLNFTRLGRAWERTHTVFGLVQATVALATIASPPLAMATAAVTLCFWKGLGLGMGKVMDSLVKSGAEALNGPKP